MRPVSVTYTEHPNGMPHTRATIAKMAKLARDGSSTYEIRHLATEITRDVPSKAPTLELAAIYRWVRDHIRYRYDPLECEWLQAPARTVAEGAGDCDDMTILIAALAGALGHPWRFRTVGATPSAQAHVAAQCHDRKVWIDLDPVIEPTQPTTAPRSDLGMFGLRAKGADILWDQEGRQMLSGHTHHARARGPRPMRVNRVRLSGLGAPVSLELVEQLYGPGPLLSGLGAPASPKLAELWAWSPYYAPVPPATEYGMQPPQPGVAPTPDPRYRSAFAPGFQGGQPITLTLPVGSISDGYLNGDGFCTVPVHIAGLGGGFLRKLKRGIKKGAKSVGGGIVKGLQKTAQFADKVTHTGPIAKAEHWLQDAASKTVVLKPFVDLHKKVFAPLTDKALSKAGLIKRAPRKLDVKGGVKAAASAAASKAGAASSSAVPALKALPAGAAAVVKKLPTSALRPVARTASPLAALKAATSRAQAAVAHAVPQLKPVAKKPVAKPSAQINASLRRKYPSNSRQVFDRAVGRFRIFAPVAAGVHGLGALQPHFSISFGGLGAAVPASSRPDVVAKAKTALSAVNTFAKNHAGKPPAVHIPAVQAFQVAEKGLSMDGLYGANTRAAMAYYLPPGTKLPAVAPALNGKVTWQAPQAAAPAPKPVVAKPVAPKPIVAKPVAPKPVAPVVPAGYREVGQEAQNPGFPPVGAPETKVGTAKPAPGPVVAVRPVQRTPVMLPPPGPHTTQGQLTRVVDDAGIPSNAIVVDHGQLVDVTTHPSNPLPNVDVTPLPSYPHVNNWPEEKSDANTWLWLAAGYLYWKKHHKRAA